MQVRCADASTQTEDDHESDEKIKDPKIVDLRQEVTRLEQELAQATSQISKLNVGIQRWLARHAIGNPLGPDL